MSRDSVEYRTRHHDVAGWAGPVIGFALMYLCGTYWLAHQITGAKAGVNPFALPLNQVDGRAPAPGPAQWLTWAVLAMTPVVLVLLVWRRRHRGARSKGRVDPAAGRMGDRSDVRPFLPANARAKAERLRVEVGEAEGEVGLQIGRTLTGRRDVLRQSWEDCSIDVTGPRRGKSSARAIPAILDAPGPVLSTGNKPELAWATWKPRSAVGNVHLYDPQLMMTEPTAERTTCFNVLRMIKGPSEAADYADLWRLASISADAKADDYWSPSGVALVGDLMLAAAADNRTMLDVYRWLLNPKRGTAEPASILEEHGYEFAAFNMRELGLMNDKQRDGVYGAPRNWLRPLADPRRARWIVPGNGPELDPEEFVDSRDTLYLVSQKSGAGSGAALVASVVKAIFDTAQARSGAQPVNGVLPRIDPPLVAVLDEIANTCRLGDMPDHFSHFGSRGICLMAFLQSYKQGRNLWGDAGMDALWGSATVRLYGGGEADTQWLRSLSELIGKHTVIDKVTSHGQGPRGRTVSEQRSREYTLDVDALGSLDEWRAVLLSQAGRPALIETVPWWKGPYAAAVEDSLATPLANVRTAARRA